MKKFILLTYIITSLLYNTSLAIATCNSYCKTCAQNGTTCLECKDKCDGDGCFLKGDTCYSCPYGVKGCHECNYDTNHDRVQCVEYKHDSFYDDENNYIPCKMFMENCETCSKAGNSTACNSCEQPSYPIKDANGKIISCKFDLTKNCGSTNEDGTCASCINGYTKSNGECVKSPNHPNTMEHCASGSNVKCDYCADGYVAKNGNCICNENAIDENGKCTSSKNLCGGGRYFANYVKYVGTQCTNDTYQARYAGYEEHLLYRLPICAEGTLRLGSSCYLPSEGCPENYYASDDGKCKLKPNGCTNVNADGTCADDECWSGYSKNAAGYCTNLPVGCKEMSPTGACSICEGEYLEKDGSCISASAGCGAGYRQFENWCNRIQYTPAEAAPLLHNDNTNEVTITFKK